MAYRKGDSLEAFNAELANANMRGQWLSDDRRESGVGGSWQGDVWAPHPRGKPHIWKWAETERLLERSGEAISESFTARRALMFANPCLERSATHTMNVGVQMIKPGELAWTHRHTISALRFVIEGHPDLHTVVDGAPCPMEAGDLVLTPNWDWHDHHNASDGRALWLDVLDGPVVAALNQTVFESYGEDRQPVRNDVDPARLRFPWKDMRKALDEMDGPPSPHDGHAVAYRDPETGGSPLRTLGPAVQRLPEGFTGMPHRRSASAVHFVIEGRGRTEVDGKALEWGARDCFVVPAWARYVHANTGDGDALLFTVSDRPLLEALGLYREDRGTGASP